LKGKLERTVLEIRGAVGFSCIRTSFSIGSGLTAACARPSESGRGLPHYKTLSRCEVPVFFIGGQDCPHYAWNFDDSRG
jgi:hypothetical protein